MEKIELYHGDFYSEAQVNADSGGDWMLSTMFEMFEGLASENGDVEALDYTPHKSPGARIDGYHFDAETGTATIAVADFRNGPELEKLNAADVTKAFKRAEKFVKSSFLPDFVSGLEESSAGFQVAYLLLSEKQSINRVKILLFSNARLVARMKGLEHKKVDGITFSYNVLDFGRYYDIVHSRTGNEPVEIDITEFGSKPLAFLAATSNKDEYESFLLAIPGDLLARIYSEFGARLLEQNVRTFLQARGKVNRGIQKTLKDDPEMFFAYNNGITATASSVKVVTLPDGNLGISGISNLQIVNGAQTTASMLYARDKNNIDLSNIFIQVKLSVISEERLKEVVPKISRFANTQNRVSEADFFSNHPFHVRIEGFSRRIFAPPREGQFSQSKWFYERARGQYRDKQAYLSDSKKKSFLSQYPKKQMFTKTDLAKYDISFARKPDKVSMGAQKNFRLFADGIENQWDKSDTDFNEHWYRDAIAKAIVFRELDKMVRNAPYGRAYKANIVTYSIAWLCEFLRSGKEAELDLSKVWQLQSMTPQLRNIFVIVSEEIAYKIQDTPDTVRNVTEWCKKQACWAGVARLTIDLDPRLVESVCKSKDSVREEKQEAKKIQRIDNGVSSQVRVFELGERWRDIQQFAMANDLLTPEQDQAIRRILNGKIPTTHQTKALERVLQRVSSEGMDI